MIKANPEAVRLIWLWDALNEELDPTRKKKNGAEMQEALEEIHKKIDQFKDCELPD
jgi:hypothetical protein